MLRLEATMSTDKHIPVSITGTGADRESQGKDLMPDQFARWLHANSISAATNWSSDVLVSWALPNFSCGAFLSCGSSNGSV
jgi:hypothetical protein